jgi:hypothetical protein
LGAKGICLQLMPRIASLLRNFRNTKYSMILQGAIPGGIP